MDSILSILIGLGLAAACGFRVFVPLLVLAIASKAGMVELGSGLNWVGSTEAILAFGTASLLEVVAYWIPWLDHALDTLASPAAVVAGTLAAASQFGDVAHVSPLMQWASALVAGGGVAGVVQAANVTTRAGSTLTTAGIANPIISAAQSVLAVVVSIVSIVAPVLGAILLLLIAVFVMRVVSRFRRSRALRAV